jgi:tetratricopeptide (TPR) repeat protein
MMSESARALYEALRALEHRARTARRASGQVHSRRETAHAAAREPHRVQVDSRRISDWVPPDFGKAKVPRATETDKVLAIVRVWSAWASDPAPDRRYWENLLEAAQPQRAARSDSPGHVTGCGLDQVTDPFAVEVHRAIDAGPEVTGLPVLPAYVRREHDVRLGEVVQAAAAGRSGIAVVAGGSSTGKTRACWEALVPLRESGGWRLWQPADARASLSQLQKIGSRTVVWLDETHNHYLHTPGTPDGEQLASGIRGLLHDPAAAPVLVLAIMWDSTWDKLTTMPPDAGDSGHPRARSLLLGHGIRVPTAVTSHDDLMGLRTAAASDPRLAEAMAQAPDGEVFQYLAGALVLLERYGMASDVVKALVLAAVDARRLGHSRELPLSLLEAGAQGYLSGTEWRRVASRPDWLKEALVYTEAESRGVRGPLTRFRPRPGASSDRPRFILADYLERHIGANRQATAVPAVMWEALLAHHASTADLVSLAHTASRRGLLRLACRLYSAAAETGYAPAYRDVASILEAAGRADEALDWWVRYLENPATPKAGYAAEHVAALLERAGRVDEALDWSRRAAAAGNSYAADEVIRLMEMTGRFDEAIEWLAERKSSRLQISRSEMIASDDEGEAAFLTAQVARMLLKAGRVDEGMTLWQRALSASAGYWPASAAWVENAVAEAGKAEEATAWLRAAAEAGTTAGLTFMEKSLARAGSQIGPTISNAKPAEGPSRSGSTGETPPQSDSSKVAGNANAREAARRVAAQGQSDEALGKLRSRIDSGEYIGAELDIAITLLSLAGRAEEAITWCRNAARNPNANYESAAYATSRAADLLTEAGRTEEAITWLMSIAENAGLTKAMEFDGIPVRREAVSRAAKLLAKAGRADEIIAWLREHANTGVFDALEITEKLLRDCGREEEAQSLRRYGWEPDGTRASPWAATMPSGPLTRNALRSGGAN